jgi:hypothetical protein
VTRTHVPPLPATVALFVLVGGAFTVALSQERPATRPATSPATTQAADDPVARIRDEGLNHPQVMQTLSYLTDVIGPRLTGSPNLRRANEWTRKRMASWGMANAHLEPWGPFGRGWSLRRFSAQIIEPQTIPLIGYPRAWTPGFERPLVAPVVHLDPRTEADLQALKGKLRGVAVLVGATRELQARFEPLAQRLDDPALLKLANSDGSPAPFPGRAQSIPPSERRAMLEGTPLARAVGGRRGQGPRPTSQPTTAPATSPATGPTTGPTSGPTRRLPPGRVTAFLVEEGAAVMISPSTQGDGGTFFVAQASLPNEVERRRPSDEPETRPAETRPADTRPADQPRGPRPWQADAPATVPQIVLAAEHFNRLARMIQQGERLTLALDLQVQFHDDDPMAYNTVAEIPGTDLKDEIVMLGAHLDSWHSGTGATDNGAGCAAVMEAARVLKALDLRPRRTIRVGLWTGEEQGIYGSKAYVKKHFGYFADDPDGLRPQRGEPATGPSTRPARPLVRQDEYDKFCAYFNLDNGTGKVRGVYLQNNEAVRPLFRNWLKPFADLGAGTLTLADTSGTDHLSFDAIGLPGFQFIQDPVEYWTRTHHSNADLFERAQEDDLKQASVILATFAWNAATADEKLPRKPVK